MAFHKIRQNISIINMKKTPNSWVFLCAASWLVFSAVAAPQDVMQVGPIKLGDSISQVEKSLGKPLSVKRLEGFIVREFYYRGIKVQFDESNIVAGIESAGSNYCFDDWLCPGMSFDAVKKFGETHGARYLKGELLVYGDGCWISATPKDGKVGVVSLKCEP